MYSSQIYCYMPAAFSYHATIALHYTAFDTNIEVWSSSEGF